MNQSPDTHNNSMTSWTDAPTRTTSAGRSRSSPTVQLGRSTRGAGGLPHPPGRGPGQLGPPGRGRHRRRAPGHHLRQPGRRRLHRLDAATIQEMARDAITFIRALGLDQVDLFGFSMGGMIAQVIAQQEPRLVRKMILAGPAPRAARASTR